MKSVTRDASNTTCLYRFDYHLESKGYIDECGEFVSSGYANVKLSLQKYPIEKITPKGKRISGRWVSNSSRKRWAWPTIEEAKISFVARKRKQLKILAMREHYVNRALALIEYEYPTAPSDSRTPTPF